MEETQLLKEIETSGRELTQRFGLEAIVITGVEPLEVVAKHIIQTKFIAPKERPYQTQNLYAVLERQRKLEKEVSAIAKGTYKKGSGKKKRRG